MNRHNFDRKKVLARLPAILMILVVFTSGGTSYGVRKTNLSEKDCLAIFSFSEKTFSSSRRPESAGVVARKCEEIEGL